MYDGERNLDRLSDEMDDLAESFLNGNHNHVIDRIQEDADANARDDYIIALLAVGIYQRLADHDSDLNDAHQLTTHHFQLALERRAI